MSQAKRALSYARQMGVRARLAAAPRGRMASSPAHLARLFLDASEAYAVAADALEEAGEQRLADAANRRSVDLGRTALGYRRSAFIVSKTYEIWGEEDLEAGDTNRRGFVYSDKPMSFTEVLREVRELGWFEKPDLQFSTKFSTTDVGGFTLYGTEDDEDYQTGDRTSHALHIHGSARALRRLVEQLRVEFPRQMRDASRGRAAKQATRVTRRRVTRRAR